MSGPHESGKLSQAEIDETWNIFIEEAGEHLDAVESILMALEKAPGGKEQIKQLFRSLHTLKGMAGLQGLSGMHRLAHKSEDLAGLVRDHDVPLDAAMIDLLLEVQDALKAAVAQAIQTRADVPVSGDLLQRLERLYIEKQNQTERQPPASAATPVQTPAPRLDEADAPATPLTLDPEVLAYFRDLAAAELLRIEASAAALKSGGADGGATLRQAAETLSFAAGQMGYAPLAAALEALGGANLQNPDVSLDALIHGVKKHLADSGVAVHGMEPETPAAAAPCPADHPEREGAGAVPACLPHKQAAAEAAHEKAAANGHDMENIASRIGEMAASVSEMEHVIARLAQLELRKSVMQEVKNGLAVCAEKSGEERERLLSALDASLLAADEDFQRLERGMERIKSVLNRFQEIPAVSAYRKIVDGIVTRAGNIRYIVPIETVQQILCPEPEQIVYSTVDGGKSLNLRGELIPLCSLNGEENDPPRSGKNMLVVVEAAWRLVALSVDEVIGQRQILINPLQGFMREIKGAAGCCILGSGEVGVVLDTGKMFENYGHD